MMGPVGVRIVMGRLWRGVIAVFEEGVIEGEGCQVWWKRRD